jgi:hypothetical protein
MAAKDFFHETVKEALINDGWIITKDPLKVIYGDANYKIDLGAERVIAAEKENEKIAVEIKTFSEPSFIYAFHGALGQYMNYRRGLRKSNEKYELFLAVSTDIYDAHFTQIMVQDAINEEGLKVLIFNPLTKTIEQWIR